MKAHSVRRNRKVPDHNLPRSITVLGQKFRVVVKDLGKASTEGSEDGPLHGLTEPDERIIKIDVRASKGYEHKVLVHELVHAGLAISGLSEVLGEKSEEALCRMVESLFGNAIDFSKVE